MVNYRFVAKENLICDKCNAYFAVKIERFVMESHPGSAASVIGVAKTKKGKMRKHAVTQGEMASIKTDIDKRKTTMPADSMQVEVLDDGNLKAVLHSNSKVPWNPKILARFLYKITFEAIENDGRMKLHDPIRKRFIDFIRCGIGKQSDFPFLYETGDHKESAPKVRYDIEEKHAIAISIISFHGVVYTVPFVVWGKELALDMYKATLVRAKNDKIGCIEVTEVIANFNKVVV